MSSTDCEVKTEIVLVSSPTDTVLYSTSFPADTMVSVYGVSQCAAFSGCKTCISWTNLVLNSTYASGCARVNMSCAGYVYLDQSMGCFVDTTVIPQCYADSGCPTCSGHGNCDKDPEQCSCDSGYSGDTCSHLRANDLDEKTVSAVVIAVVSIVVIAGVSFSIAVIWFFVKKRTEGRPRFNHLDLLENDTLATELGEEN